MKNLKTKVMIETSLLVAMAVVLDYVAGIYSQPFWPFGGSVSLTLVPIAVLAYRHGVVMGVVGGFLVGVVQLVMGASIIHPAQVLLDYPLPFAALGLCGLFARGVNGSTGRKQMLMILVSTAFASCIRLISHVISGVIFYAVYAPKGMNPWVYAIVYNGPFIVLSYVVSAIVLVILYKRHSKQLVIRK